MTARGGRNPGRDDERRRPPQGSAAEEVPEAAGFELDFDPFRENYTRLVGPPGATSWLPEELPAVFFASREVVDGRSWLVSTQNPASDRGRIDLDAFARFASEVGDLALDCILEVKDKEQSVLRAHAALRGHRLRG